MLVDKPQLIFLMGPTASGKTDLAVRLAQDLPLEIISVDSAMIYRGMDIGTGKPSPSVLAAAPHHLIDIRDPHESYSAAQFREDALKWIQAIHARGKIPLLVGGTMLYFKTLKYGISALPQADAAIRRKLALEREKYGLEALHQRLRQIDAVAAQRIHPNDPQRLLRALEVYELTGKSLTEHFTPQETLSQQYSVVEIALIPEQREVLHAKIRERFLAMLKQGFIDEVTALYARGDLSRETPSIRSVGYRQIWDYLRGDCDIESMRAQAIAATRQLAKRQLTWLRSWKNVRFFSMESKTLFSDVSLCLQTNLK